MLLSICIPTYNRCGKVLSLLRFIVEEVKSFSTEEVEIIVSDNCSTDNTQAVLNEYVQDKGIINYNRNSENLGLIGNLHRLVELAHGQYVWFMGDDDIYYQGVAGQVISKLKGGRIVICSSITVPIRTIPMMGLVFQARFPRDCLIMNLGKLCLRYSIILVPPLCL